MGFIIIKYKNAVCSVHKGECVKVFVVNFFCELENVFIKLFDSVSSWIIQQFGEFLKKHLLILIHKHPYLINFHTHVL